MPKEVTVYIRLPKGCTIKSVQECSNLVDGYKSVTIRYIDYKSSDEKPVIEYDRKDLQLLGGREDWT